MKRRIYGVKAMNALFMGDKPFNYSEDVPKILRYMYRSNCFTFQIMTA